MSQDFEGVVEGDWTVLKNGQRIGPMKKSSLLKYVKEGVIRKPDQVQGPGFNTWTDLDPVMQAISEPIDASIPDGESIESQRETPRTETRKAGLDTKAAANRKSIVDQPISTPSKPKPRTGEDFSHKDRTLLQWAFIPSGASHNYNRRPHKNVYDALKELSLPEKWHLGKGRENKRWPLLQRYISFTFERLRKEQGEEKIYYTEQNGRRWAVFNTGLVDKVYNPICMLFSQHPNFDDSDAYPPWRLYNICVSGQGDEGKRLDELFKKTPPAAKYLTAATDLIIPPGEEIKFSESHVIFDAIEDDRYPSEFLQRFAPRDLEWEDYSNFEDEEKRKSFLWRYRDQICNRRENIGRYREIVNRIKDAIDVASKRTFWNYKTAIPSYYPKHDEVSLLLPLCLDDRDDTLVTVALVVSKIESGLYRAWTVYPLQWAYERARVVCRPDSDWLIPEKIETRDGEE